MKATVKTQLGNVEYVFEIDENEEMETLHRVAVLGNPPQYCNECKNADHFRLDSNKDKESNIYVNVVCRKCGAKAKLGRYKAGGYFWHKFEKYEKQGNNGPNTEPSPGKAEAVMAEIEKNTEEPPPIDDDLPF